MKPRSTILRLLLPLLSALLLVPAVMSAAPPPPAAPAKTPPATNTVEVLPQSVFLASSPTQLLRDPFFPESSRRPAATPVAMAVARTNAAPASSIDLKLKAIFGTPERPFATINSTTFEVGEEQDLVTPSGRIKVRCVAIRPADETVIVEAAGTRRELRFSKRK